MKVAVFSKYNRIGPSSYYRVYQFIENYSQKNTVKVQYFWGDYYFKYVMNKKGFKKLLFMIPGLISGYVRRIIFTLFFLYKYDIVRIEKDFLPGTPVAIEFYIKYVLRKKIIFEMDDGVFLTNYPKSKTQRLISMVDTVIVGNRELENYAKKYNNDIFIVPTGVDFSIYKKIIESHKSLNGTVIVGWIGSSSGLKFIKQIESALLNLESEGLDFQFHIICNSDIDMKIKNKRFIKWDRATADANMAKFDIGIMPLNDDEFNKYKCGFKIIQYIAMSIPVVASPIGVNNEIINDGMSGYLAKTEFEWETYLRKLILSESLRKSFSNKALELNTNKFDTIKLQECYDDIYDHVFLKFEA